jgi:hypothetical protein
LNITRSIGVAYLFVAGTQCLPFLAHETTNLGNLHPAEVTRRISLDEEIRIRTCGLLDESAVLDVVELLVSTSFLGRPLECLSGIVRFLDLLGCVRGEPLPEGSLVLGFVLVCDVIKPLALLRG